MNPDKRIEVAAAVIRHQGKTFICSRPKKSALGNFWEFPGGKRETGESLEQCIVRELREELGIDVLVFDPVHTLEHDYPDKRVRVHFIRCLMKKNSPAPEPRDGQDFKWVPTNALGGENFLPADLPLASLLAGAAEIFCGNTIKIQN